MSEPELPGLGTSLGLLLAFTPFLVLALRRAVRVLPARPAGVHRVTSGEVLAVVATPFVALLLVGLLVRAPAPGAAPSGTEVLLGLASTQLVLGSAAGLALFLAARRPGGLASLGLFERFPAGAVVAVLAVYVPGFFVLNLGVGSLWVRVSRFAGWEERQELMDLIRALDGAEWALAALLAVWIGPVVEELLFRGFLQGHLARVVGERTSLVLTSLFFARLHGMAGLPVLFGLSLFLGWLQMRTRCLWVPCCAHALNNAVSLGLALAIGTQ